MNHDELRVDAARLWRRLMTMAEIGATPNGGVCRLALSDEDRQARDLFIQWCMDAGCTITIDRLGNIFARRQGEDSQLAPVLVGSHLDSQPTGGKFDGALGVLAGLELVETLNDQQIVTRHPLEIVSWTNEEGARFVPAMLASGVFAGVFDLAYALSRTDKAGLTVAAELDRIGYAGVIPVASKPIHAAFELHIEQGPLLEAAAVPIGVVTGVQGARWYQISILGQEAHAGTTPMALRRDPLPVMAELVTTLFQVVARYQPDARLTIGSIEARPGAINTVPGSLELTLDLRHPDDAVLDQMESNARDAVDEIGSRSTLPIQITQVWQSSPVRFSELCVNAVRQAAKTLDLPWQDMISGAGHDSVYLSRVAATGMIFIPCQDGLSHNEAENITPEHAAAGANVLLHAVLRVSR